MTEIINQVDNSFNIGFSFSLPKKETFFCNTVYERTNFVRPIKQDIYTLENGLIIKNNTRYIKSKVKKDNCISYDSETYEGKCRLLCLSESDKSKSKYLLRDKENDLEFFEKCLDFLMYKSNHSNYYHFFYNIDFDITAILKLWNDFEQINYLSKGIQVSYKQYKLTWLKGRIFILKKGKRVKYFTDLFNFFKIGLNESSKIYLKDNKIDNIDGNLLNTNLDYWNDKLDKIIEYCIYDCYLTSNLGLELIKAILDCNIELPKYLVSSASLSKSDFRYKCFIPKIESIPQKILQIAYNTYFGGRFEMLRSGCFNNLYLYDINSQYPSFIKKLPNLKYGGWRHYKNLKELPKLKMFGYFKAKLRIPESNYISTIPIKHKQIVKFPNGFFNNWFTWYDLDLMREFIIEISEAFIWISDKNPKKRKREYKPFKKRITELYLMKDKYKNTDKLRYNITKLCMNALYGCFIEQHKNYNPDNTFELKSGILFNSVYASQITSYGRWSVLKDIKKSDYKHLIAIHTDSIITDKELNYLKIGKTIGKWSLEVNGKGIILNTGMYQIANIVKTRGIPKKYIKDWFSFCKENRDKTYIEFNINHMTKIREAIIQDKSLDKTNTMNEKPKSIFLNSDHKRTWNNKFLNFNDLLNRNIESIPIMCVYNDSIDNFVFPNPLYF